MSEENKQKLPRGVIVEFDFTALDGAEILFNTARARLAACGIDLTVKLEALHLANGNCQGALAELFQVFGKKHDPAKAARELTEAFHGALTAAVPGAVTPGFTEFVKVLTDRGLKVIVSTRADVEAVKAACGACDPALVSFYAEPSQTYGNCKWDAWRRCLRAFDLHEMLTVAVTGSGFGVKSALVAGMSAMAIVHDHVAYQDFGGADFTAGAFSAELAHEALHMLHLED